MIRISVITITYNAAEVIGRTLQSVLEQTHSAVEHIIVDGASKDQTLTLASEYKHRSYETKCGHEVIITSEPDRGIYDAMNKGLQAATGDYVIFMNAGDTFHAPDTLESIAQCANQSPLPAVIYGDTDVVDDQGNFLHRRRLSPPEQLSWRSFRNGMLVCHQAFYARTDLAKATPYNLQYRLSADVDWCIRVMKAAARQQLPLVNVHKTVADYQEEGQTTRNHKASLRERFDVMCHHYGLLSTLVMHFWFALRSVFCKGKN